MDQCEKRYLNIPVGHIYVQLIEGWDEHLVAWAENEIQVGSNEASVIELADYTAPINSFEFNETLKSLSAEFRVDLQNPVKCLYAFIHEASEAEIVQKNPDVSLGKIRNAVHRIEELTGEW